MNRIKLLSRFFDPEKKCDLEEPLLGPDGAPNLGKEANCLPISLSPSLLSAVFKNLFRPGLNRNDASYPPAERSEEAPCDYYPTNNSTT